MQYKYFGKFIRNKRKELKISLNELAFNSEVEPASLSKFETQKSDILFSNFTKIAKGFNLTPAELLYEFEVNKNKFYS